MTRPVLLEPLAQTRRGAADRTRSAARRELRERIARAAGGNPLFVEEMLALCREAGGGEVEVPPTIQALLAARLDQLDAARAARARARRGRGRGLPPRRRQALAPEEPQVTPRLAALVRKELIRPDKSAASPARTPSASATC